MLYIVKITYPEDNLNTEVALALFHHRKNAVEFIIELTGESEASDDTLDAGDIESMLDETDVFVDEVSGIEYEIIPAEFKDER